MEQRMEFALKGRLCPEYGFSDCAGRSNTEYRIQITDYRLLITLYSLTLSDALDHTPS